MSRTTLFPILALTPLVACSSAGMQPQADLGFDAGGDVIDGEFMIADDLTAREMQTLGLEQLDFNADIGVGLYLADDDGVSVSALQRALDQNSRNGAAVEANRPRSTYSVNDPYYKYQWDMTALGVETAWTTTKGAGVRVAVIDTGLFSSGEDRPVHVAAGYDFVDNDSDPNDLNGHGTHVSGTIAQATNNGKGCVGVAPDAEIMPVRVLDANGSGDSYAVTNGITWAVDHGAKVINMSYGGFGVSQAERDAVDYAWGKGLVLIASAGNHGTTDVAYPAGIPKVIPVAATDQNDQRANSALSAPGLRLPLLASTS